MPIEFQPCIRQGLNKLHILLFGRQKQWITLMSPALHLTNWLYNLHKKSPLLKFWPGPWEHIFSGVHPKIQKYRAYLDFKFFTKFSFKTIQNTLTLPAKSYLQRTFSRGAYREKKGFYSFDLCFPLKITLKKVFIKFSPKPGCLHVG